VPSTFCNGTTTHVGAHDGKLADLDLRDLKSRFPAAGVGSFNGREPGLAGPQTANGRPNTMPYAFTVRVVVTTTQATPMTGEDRRQMFLHRDQDMLNGHFPIELHTDGASSPLLADISGSNRNQLIVATSDGVIHAYQPDGSELTGWPVHTDPLPLHGGERAFTSGEVSAGHYGAVLGSLAAGDLFHDGRLEVVADDVEGKIYAWDASGHLVFRQEANPAYSGHPLTPFVNVRMGVRDRTDHSFYAGPVLADLTGSGKELDIIAAGTDRHVYAWHPSGQPVAGFPVEVYDHSKVSAVDPTTHHLTFNDNAGQPEDQGKLVDTPAVARLHPSDPAPSIIVGSNEEYVQNSGDEGPINASSVSNASLGALGPLGLLNFGNSRLYAIKADGTVSGQPFLAGWPKKIALIDVGLLPDVGEGITGSPAVASTTCPSGGAGPKIGVIPDAGPGYLLNPDGSSCYGSSGGQDNALPTDTGGGNGQVDRPVFPAVGEPAFGNIGGQLDFLAPAAGLTRAIDVAAPEYQGGQDFISAWDTTSGQFHSGFPSPVNDLQFVTGPAVADVLGQPGEQAVGGTASLDLAAINASGSAASSKWPKLTIANPTIGSFGTDDTKSAAHKVVVSITRSGTLAVYGTPAPACSPSSWPRFHHDIANSGDYGRDAVPPGRPVITSKANGVLTFVAPGNDLMCGTAAAYQVATSNAPITAENFAAARPLTGAPHPAAAGTRQTMTLPAGTAPYVAIRAVGQQGNLGRPGVIGPGCVDTAPYSTISPPGRRHHRLRLHGLATGTGCPAQVRAVRVSISRRASNRSCRFVTRRGRLTGAQSCNSPVYLNAHIQRLPARRRAKRHRRIATTVKWSLALPRLPPRGRYRATVQTIAATGALEAPASHRSNRLTFRMR
jgi:hypothetical protein